MTPTQNWAATICKLHLVSVQVHLVFDTKDAFHDMSHWVTFKTTHRISSIATHFKHLYSMLRANGAFGSNSPELSGFNSLMRAGIAISIPYDEVEW